MDDKEFEKNEDRKEFTFQERQSGEKPQQYWQRTIKRNLEDGVDYDEVSQVLGNIIADKESREGIDPLTELKNRAVLWHDLSETLGEIKRLSYESTPKKISLLIVDLDDLREINKKKGYRGGDEAIKKVAGVIKAAGRRTADVVARYGGDEFCLLLYNAGTEDAADRAEVIRGQAEKLGLTVSIGVATSIGGKERANQFFDRANVAVQIAKGELESELISGVPKNRVVSWQEKMPLETERKYG